MIGERIRLAREACGLTQEKLAIASGVPLGTISAIEAGRVAVPSDNTIGQISEATGFPSAFFHLGPLPDVPDGYFRKLKRGQARGDKQLRAQVREVVELVQRSEIGLGLPPVTLEPARGDLSMDDIEDVADSVRSHLRVGTRDPIPNFMRAVERAGVIVVRLPALLVDHDSYSVWPDYGLEGRPVLAITAGHPGDRDRANVGHELGHLVLHTIRTVDAAKIEKEAWRFAGAVLLPREAVREAFQLPITLRSLMHVKAVYGTSIAFNAQRARDLHLVTEEQFISLRKQISARGWTKNEPVEVVAETPLLITKIIKHLGGAGSPKEQSERVLLPPFTIRALAG